MKIVSPYRPFPRESIEHQHVGPFDWIAALRLLRASVRRSCRCETYALTDVDTVLPVPAHTYATTERRLMLWILEVSLRYLESPDFDEDTVMISPDMLVYGDLRPGFVDSDLGILVRDPRRFPLRPILNSVQWWSVAAQDGLIAFYRQVLALAATLPEDVIRWGADSDPFRRLLAPLTIGPHDHGGLRVTLIAAGTWVESFSSANMRRLEQQVPVKWPVAPVVDFRYQRKHYLARYAAATMGARA